MGSFVIGGSVVIVKGCTTMMRVRCLRGFAGVAPGSSGEEPTALARVFNKYKEEGIKGATQALRMIQRPVATEKRELRAFSVLLSFQAQGGKWQTARRVWFSLVVLLP